MQKIHKSKGMNAIYEFVINKSKRAKFSLVKEMKKADSKLRKLKKNKNKNAKKIKELERERGGMKTVIKEFEHIIHITKEAKRHRA